MQEAREHWQRAYVEREADEVSWFEASPRASLEMIEAIGLGADAPIIDVGGGASRLSRELVRLGHGDVTVADISPRALERGREEAGELAGSIRWVEADVRSDDLGRTFDLWHDRAVFHFMVDDADRAAYLRTLERHVSEAGHALIATFGPEGPERCSGLPVMRYSAEALASLLEGFSLADSRLLEHTTPGGRGQQFLYARFDRTSAGG